MTAEKDNGQMDNGVVKKLPRADVIHPVVLG